MKYVMSTLFLVSFLALVLFAQQPAQPVGKTLGDREKCKAGETCTCGSPPISVPVNCECQIDSVSKTGTSHCPVGDIGTKPLTAWVSGVFGFAAGAAVTFLAMRRRG